MDENKKKQRPTIHNGEQTQVQVHSSCYKKQSSLELLLSSHSSSEVSGHSPNLDIFQVPTNINSASSLASTAVENERVDVKIPNENDQDSNISKPSTTHFSSPAFYKGENHNDEMKLPHSESTRFERKFVFSDKKSNATVLAKEQLIYTEDEVKPLMHPVLLDTTVPHPEINEIIKQNPERHIVFQKQHVEAGTSKPCIKTIFQDIIPQTTGQNTKKEGKGVSGILPVILKQPLSPKDRQTVNPHHQTGPPQEVTLQPSALPTILRQAKDAECKSLLTYEQSKDNDTPPPSYQESLKYPFVSNSQPPDFGTAAATSSNRREAGISFIKFSNHHTGCHSPKRDDIRESVLMLHQSPSDEVTNRRMTDPYSDHQILALLACIMFWPIGLIAIYYANMANVLQSEGIHNKSVQYSKRALVLSLMSFTMGMIVYLSFYLQRKTTKPFIDN